MTGGTLPAMTWHDIMQYAHSGVDLKPLPGMALIAAQGPPVPAGGASAGVRRPDRLTRKASDTVGAIEVLMKSASARRAMLDLGSPGRASVAAGAGAGNSAIVELR
jgi:penicillin-binding protein 1A